MNKPTKPFGSSLPSFWPGMQALYKASIEAWLGASPGFSAKVLLGPTIARDIRSVTPASVLAVKGIVTKLLANNHNQINAVEFKHATLDTFRGAKKRCLERLEHQGSRRRSDGSRQVRLAACSTLTS